MEFLKALNWLSEGTIFGESVCPSVFTGSSRWLMSSDIPDDEFAFYKPIVGDIDVLVPAWAANSIDNVIKKHLVVNEFTILGSNNIGRVKSCMVRKDEGANHQIDLISTEFDLNWQPTPWSVFSHSVAWDDLKVGIKGSFHKIALAALAGLQHHTIPIVENDNRYYRTVQTRAFSPIHGLRKLYVFREGAYHPVKPGEPGTEPITEPAHLFVSLLGGQTPNEQELKLFGSFVGLVELIRRNFSIENQHAFIRAFVERLYGSRARTLDPQPVRDAKTKRNVIIYLRHAFPGVFVDEFERTLSQIRGNFYAEKFG